MEFSFHEPPPPLADSVKAIWCARGTKQEFDAPEPIVPDGCVEIIFNLGDRFINADTGELQPRDLLAGQMTRPVIALPTGDVDLIGVRFKTGRAGAALRMPMWELQDQLIAASDVVARPRSAGRRSAEHRRTRDRLDHLARALAAASTPSTPMRMAHVDEALEIIDASRGTIAIETRRQARRDHAPASRAAVPRIRRPWRQARRADRTRSIRRSTCCSSSRR